MITEVFVSLNGIDYNKLDLEGDETIPMRYTSKDTQDISKIFSPYSLDFTFKASPNNLLSLGHFGNTDVIKTTDLRKIKCKIYVNGILNQFGLLKLEKNTYKFGKPDIITASFSTNMTNLKDRIGEDTIDLLSNAVVEWMPRDIWQRMTSINYITVDGIPLKYFVPLASTNRVLQYDEVDLNVLDNIIYGAGNSPTSTKVIKGNELRPCISLSTIIDLIKKKYGLIITSPIESRTEFKDAYIWCTNENLSTDERVKFIITADRTSTPFKFFDSGDYVRVFKPTGVARTNYFSQRIRLSGLVYLSENTSLTIDIVKRGTDEILISETFNLENETEDMTIQIPDFYLTSDVLEYEIFFKFNNVVIWNNSELILFYRSIFLPFGNIDLQLNTNNNFLLMGGAKIDLIKSLPPTKVIDFLTSYFKAFNLSVLDITPDDDSLYWYTQKDIEENKKTVTYVADISEVPKSVQDDYNYYIFKHAESNYKSNVDYKIGAGEDYAQTSFPSIKPIDAKEFKVETDFTIIPPVTLAGTEDITTYYGFESGTPDILDTGEARYTPNFGELVLFYSHGNQPLNRSLGVQSSLLNGNLITQPITSYIKVLPYTTDLKSFSWSVLVIENLALPNNLFSLNYLKQIERLIDQNSMKQDFKLTLTPDELRNFRLENDIIIGEDKFSSLDATLDVITGKTTLTLLNY